MLKVCSKPVMNAERVLSEVSPQPASVVVSLTTDSEWRSFGSYGRSTATYRSVGWPGHRWGALWSVQLKDRKTVHSDARHMASDSLAYDGCSWRYQWAATPVTSGTYVASQAQWWLGIRSETQTGLPTPPGRPGCRNMLRLDSEASPSVTQFARAQVIGPAMLVRW